MKNILLFIAILCFSAEAFSQSPQSFNYQAVVRDGSGEILSSTNVSFRFNVLEASPNGSTLYTETHQVSTNEMGLVNLSIGEGTPSFGTFSTIDWSAASHFLKVDLDVNGGSSFVDMGTQQLLSVPYAIHANTVTNSDNDNTNEIQVLSLNGSELSLSNGGGSIDLPVGDSVVIQTLDRNGNTATLSHGGGSISIADDDSDPSNELQTIIRAGNQVNLSDNGGSFSIADADSNSSNELQTISRTGNNVTLSHGGGSFSVADNDSNSINELQDLYLVNDTLFLTDGATGIPLSEGSYWEKNGDALLGNYATIATGTDNYSTDYSVFAYSRDSMNYGLYSGNPVTQSGTAINVQTNTSRADTSTGYTYGMYNYLNYSPKSGASFATIGLTNYITSNPDDNSSQRTYGIYQDINRSDSGSGETVGNYLDLRHSGNDGELTGSYEYVRASGDNQELFYGHNREFHKTGEGFGNTMYGTHTYMTRSASSNTSTPSKNLGTNIGDHLEMVYNPTGGSYHTYGKQSVIHANPDDAATGRVYGYHNTINRGDSGSGSTYGYYLDLNQTGNDGSVFGTYHDLDLTGYSSDNAYGGYTNISKTGNGSLYGKYTYTRRLGGFGKTYGTYNYTVSSPDSGSVTNSTHANHTKLVSSPDVDIVVVGNYLDLDRGGSGAGHTYGNFQDIRHTTASGYLYGNRMNIERTATAAGEAFGEYIELRSKSGWQTGMRVDMELGVIGQTHGGNQYGADITSRRLGNVSTGCNGLYAESLNDGTGSGFRTSIGVNGYANLSSANGTAYAYGVYGSANGGDAAYAGFFAGDVYVSGSYLPSDVKLKHNVTVASSSLQRILDLQVYRYEYDSADYSFMQLPKGEQTGFLAQELKESFPELTKAAYTPPLRKRQIEDMEAQNITVSDKAREGVEFTAVNYAGLVPHLTLAIQEQQKVISEQEETITAQQAELEAINKRLAKMETVLNNLSQNK